MVIESTHGKGKRVTLPTRKKKESLYEYPGASVRTPGYQHKKKRTVLAMFMWVRKRENSEE